MLIHNFQAMLIQRWNVSWEFIIHAFQRLCTRYEQKVTILVDNDYYNIFDKTLFVKLFRPYKKSIFKTTVDNTLH